MHYFQYKGDELFCDDVSIKGIAQEVGTPLYLYSYRTLIRHAQNIDGAFKDIDHITCYSVKANWNLTLLHILAKRGLGADIVSGGELYRALKAGFTHEKIVYSGVGKSTEEIEYALGEGILAFNVESAAELKEIDQIAGKMGLKAPVSLRINPDVDPETHPYISTGLRESKFGIPHSEALESFKMARSLPNLDVIGIDSHIGSQITTVAPFVESVERLVEMVDSIRDLGIDVRYIDIGGGLGIRYKDEEPPEPLELAEAIVPLLSKTGCTIIFEPGRSMVGNVGVLVSKVLYVKRSEEKTFVIVDAGINDLIRPSFYDSYHDILPLERSHREKVVADVVGPICESGDFLAKDREVTAFKSGDLMAFMSAGAYGFCMSSNYNCRPRPPEVMTVDGSFEIIKERETYSDLIRGERIIEI